MRVNDFIPDLKGAIAELSDSAEVRHLASMLGSAWTSSSEMLGEIGGQQPKRILTTDEH